MRPIKGSRRHDDDDDDDDDHHHHHHHFSEPIFWEGDATKHFSMKKWFSVERGEAIQ